jgi:hypothetical protein
MTSSQSFFSNGSSPNQFKQILAKRGTEATQFKVVKENITVIGIY